MTKDIVWTYANAVSQVCVEDDSVSGIVEVFAYTSHASVSANSSSSLSLSTTWSAL